MEPKHFVGWGDESEIGELICDDRELVVDTMSHDFVGIEKATGDGRLMESIYALLRMKFGGMTAVHRRKHPPFVDRLFAFQSTDLIDRTPRMLRFPAPSGKGSVTMFDEPLFVSQRCSRFSPTTDRV